jgi:hypothetical protein
MHGNECSNALTERYRMISHEDVVLSFEKLLQQLNNNPFYARLNVSLLSAMPKKI